MSHYFYGLLSNTIYLYLFITHTLKYQRERDFELKHSIYYLDSVYRGNYIFFFF